MSDDTNALLKGFNLHRYLIEGVLGAGGFGITYKAIHEALQNAVAIKEYFPAEWAFRDHDNITVRPNAQGQIPAKADEPSCYQWGLQRFLDEAKILVQINHPGVVRVRDYFTANGTAYIVMEYENGESLSALLQRGGILPEQELRRLLDDILPALEAVHSQGYLHRDIKPSNLYMRKQDNHVLLIDFGAARQALGHRTRSVTSVVTPGYSPIEQYVTVGEDYGPWTDIYALGAVLYRCINGAPPVEAPGRVLKDPVQPAVELGAGLYTHGLLQVVDRALAVRPEERFQNIAEMRDALLAAEREGASADFAQVPRIRSELLDLPSQIDIQPSIFESRSYPTLQARESAAGRDTRSAPSARPASPTPHPPSWTLDIPEPGMVPPPGQSKWDAHASSLPLLDDIWEHLEPSPATPESASPVAPIPLKPQPAPLPAPSPFTAESQPRQESSSPSLLKRSPQSALERLKKAPISQRSQATTIPSAETPAAQPDAATQESLTLCPPVVVEPDPANPGELAILPPSMQRPPVNWTRVLVTVFAISGLAGISLLGLLGYEYYRTAQEQRQRETTALQERKEQEETARRAQEAIQRRDEEITLYIEQVNKSITNKDWERARSYLTRATALSPEHPLVIAARSNLLSAQQPGANIRTRIDNTTGLELSWIEGGCFSMGSPPTERDRGNDEALHQVCVKDFWIGRTEITNGQYRRFKPNHNSGSFQGRSLNSDTQPVVNLTWGDANTFTDWLSWEAKTGKRFRLPTEAEWEYAARAGATTRYYWGNDIDPRYANFSDRNDPTGASNSNLDDGQAVTAPVGSYLPNNLGLRDVAGNVWEWTCSEYDPAYGDQAQNCSEKRPNEGQRVTRGGSWNNGPAELRLAKRLPRKPGDHDAMTGFRVIMEE
ncbi:MAG: SUMF1/EgtB/PvdO family nonheme iron enzyme [Candidatus Competibacteraceae bacterium]